MLDKARIRFILWMIVTSALYLCLVTGAFGMLSIEMDMLPDLQIGIDGTTFMHMLEVQVASRTDYLLFHGIDYLFIFCFYPLLGRLATRHRVGRICALGAGICDLVENLMVDVSVLTHPTTLSFTALVLRVATALKFFGILTAVGFVAFDVSKRIIGRTKGA